MRTFKILILIFAFCGVAVAFQNCGGDMVPLDGVIESQSLWEVDGSMLPDLLNSPDLAFWSKDGNVSIKKNPALGEAYSLILAVNRSATGTLFSFSSGTDVEVARIVFDSGGNIYVLHVTDLNNYAYIKTSFPVDKEKFLVAASFGTKADDISVLIDGKKISASVVKMGNPFDYSYLSKDATLMSGSGIYQGVAYTRALSGQELNILSRYVADGSQIPGVVYDPSLTGDGGGDAGPTMQFLAAQSILNSNCMSCHGSGSPNGDFYNLTQSQFIQRGWVKPGDAAGSKIYYRLNGSAGSSGPKNMPQSGSLSTGQIKIIEDWINGIQ